MKTLMTIEDLYGTGLIDVESEIIIKEDVKKLYEGLFGKTPVELSRRDVIKISAINNKICIFVGKKEE